MALVLKLTLQKSEEFWIGIIALLVAWLLAAHQSAQYAVFGVVGTYVYWICRILIEAAFFIAVLLAVEKYLKQSIPEWAGCLLAALLSLVPFALAITALDLIVGLPELGFNDDTLVLDGKGRAFGLEIFYLLDNHLFLSGLLLLPRLLLSAVRIQPEKQDVVENKADAAEASTEPKTVDRSSSLVFLDSLTPPLDGHICSMEAQEHYILVTTTRESRMVLHRFSDAVRQTPTTLGMRVHRSHWVAHSAVQEIVVEGQSMKLRLTVGDKLVPVSRTFRAAVESRYANVQANADVQQP